MNKEMQNVIEEMTKLYNQNKIEELIMIRDSAEESDIRKLAANIALQSHRDARRLY